MQLGIVTGEVYSTINHPFYDGKRLLTVARVDEHGEQTGKYLIAVAAVDAGVGQTVLVIDEGNSARQIVGDSKAPIRSIVFGVVDEVALSES